MAVSATELEREYREIIAEIRTDLQRLRELDGYQKAKEALGDLEEAQVEYLKNPFEGLALLSALRLKIRTKYWRD